MKILELLAMLNSKGDMDRKYVVVKNKGKIMIATRVNGETTGISDIRTMLAQARRA